MAKQVPQGAHVRKSQNDTDIQQRPDGAAGYSPSGTSRPPSSSTGAGAYQGYSRNGYGTGPGRSGDIPMPDDARRGKKRTRKGGKLSTFLIIVGVTLCVIALVWLGIIVFGYVDAQNKYKGYADDAQFDTALADTAAAADDTTSLSQLTVDWDALYATNPDIVAWVYVPGTVINYPVAKSSDNDYYLHHNFDGSYSSSGTIFLDYENAADFSDQQVLLYGHHMNDGSMFACLVDFDDQGFFDEHRTVIIATPTMNYRLDTAYVFVCSGDAQIRSINYQSDALFHDALHEYYDNCMASASSFNPDTAKQVIQLVTCSYETNDSRTVLTATIAEKAVPVSAQGTQSGSTATSTTTSKVDDSDAAGEDMSATESAEQAMEGFVQQASESAS